MWEVDLYLILQAGIPHSNTEKRLLKYHFGFETTAFMSADEAALSRILVLLQIWILS